jgi:ABC-type phosphate transport system permease subunit
MEPLKIILNSRYRHLYSGKLFTLIDLTSTTAVLKNCKDNEFTTLPIMLFKTFYTNHKENNNVAWATITTRD